MEVNKENLENALSSSERIKKESKSKNSESNAPQMSKEMEIGFHQGALNTLAAERIELLKIVQNVEKIMGMHIKRLEELGIKIQTKKS